MKKYINKLITPVIFGIIVVVSGCSDFLSRPPITSFTDENYWTSEANARTYAWGLYNAFYGYGNAGGTTGEFYWQSSGSNTRMMFTDNIVNNSFINLPTNASTTNGWWNDHYVWIRKSNLMLERVETIPNLTVDAENHLLSVARFFRANSYFNLVAYFGDVPYTDTYVDPKDQDNVWAPRTSRTTVIDNVIADLEFAAQNMYENDGLNAVNKYTAYALLARVCLFEGTYRKYHELGESSTLLQKAKSAAEAVMNSGRYSLGTSFDAKYNSLDLAANKEMILFKKYVLSVLANSIQAYTHSSTEVNGISKAAIESFVCSDGLPISQSPLYMGDASFNNVIKERDTRIKAAIGTGGYSYVGNPLNNGPVATTGYLTNFWDNPSQIKTSTEVVTIGQNHIDAPVYTYSEILLIYAEACAELGSISDADLNKSINLLRKRAGIADLSVQGTNAYANGVQINDPKRSSTLESSSKGGVVSSILWEIRRERRVETMGWVYLRNQDLMRWGKGDYLDTDKNPDASLGAYLGTTTIPNLTLTNGYINRFPTSTRKFEPKHYLNSIPTSEMLLYEAEGVTLTQNTGW